MSTRRWSTSLRGIGRQRWGHIRGSAAAALTAAAEYARKTGQGLGEKSFDELSKIPGWLASDSSFGGGSNLFRLFQPQKRRGLFRFAVSFLIKSWPKRLAMWLGVFWLDILVGLTPLAGVAVISGRPWPLAMLSAVAAITTLVFTATAVPAVMRRVRAPWAGPAIALAPIAFAVFQGWRLRSGEFAVAVALAVVSIFAGLLFAVVAGVFIRLRRFPTLHFGFCTGAVPPDPTRPSHWSTG